MACYRNGGCGPYENRSCNECPASEPEYLNRDKNITPVYKEPIKIKVFVDDGTVSLVMKNVAATVEIELIDCVACSELALPEEGDVVSQYINQLHEHGFMDVSDSNVSVTNHLYDESEE